jgi:hypothetical protein
MLIAKMNAFLLSLLFQVQSGESPDFTGQWPVPPSDGFSHRLLADFYTAIDIAAERYFGLVRGMRNKMKL